MNVTKWECTQLSWKWVKREIKPVAVFDYDVFLSFASVDEELVRPIWQELSQSGLQYRL